MPRERTPEEPTDATPKAESKEQSSHRDTRNQLFINQQQSKNLIDVKNMENLQI
jgi:hypothetical protein